MRPLTEPWEHPLLGRMASRIAMTAMTRSFAGPGHVATEEMAAYYAARAREGVGLVLTESTAVCPECDGFPRMPRIHMPEQVASWRHVTDAVHAAGEGLIAAGALSAIRAEKKKDHTAPVQQDLAR